MMSMYCIVDVTAVNCRVWPFHATVFDQLPTSPVITVR